MQIRHHNVPNGFSVNINVIVDSISFLPPLTKKKKKKNNNNIYLQNLAVKSATLTR